MQQPMTQAVAFIFLESRVTLMHIGPLVVTTVPVRPSVLSLTEQRP